MTAGQQANVVRLIRSVPIFKSLRGDQLKLVLANASSRTLDPGEVLCTQGDPSDTLFILLSGKLSVRIKRSATIATVHPVTSIGELGVFTGQPRNATVEAMEKSAIITLAKDALDELIDREPALGVSIMRNVIRVLAERIAEDNIKLREFQQFIISSAPAPSDES